MIRVMVMAGLLTGCATVHPAKACFNNVLYRHGVEHGHCFGGEDLPLDSSGEPDYDFFLD